MKQFLKVMKFFIYSIVGLITLVVAWAIGTTMTISKEVIAAAPVAPGYRTSQIPGPTADWARLVKEKKIQIGMPEAEVVKSWGRPQRVNTNTYATTERKQLVYGDGQYVHLQDGIVTSISQSR